MSYESDVHEMLERELRDRFAGIALRQVMENLKHTPKDRKDEIVEHYGSIHKAIAADVWKTVDAMMEERAKRQGDGK